MLRLLHRLRQRDAGPRRLGQEAGTQAMGAEVCRIEPGSDAAVNAGSNLPKSWSGPLGVDTDQAEVLTGAWAFCSSNWIGLRYPSAE